MVISNLNIKLIEDRLGFIIEALSRLERLSLYNEQEFLKEDNPAIAESYLRRSLEAVFDIGRHIIAKTVGKGIVEYKEIARTLGDKGMLSKECSEALILMAGYRNRLVHFYHEVTERELYFILKENLGDIKKFVEEIKKFIESYKRFHEA
ncbi:MAG: type VII toxin-antitoxin system HepT family RNase toxin [Thermodesulfovibrionales bacterium]